MNKSISLLVGGLIATMILFNGTLSESIGNYSALVIIHLVGFISLVIYMIIKGQTLRLTGKETNKLLPIFLYTAGLVGVFTVLFTNISFNAIGASLTLALGLMGQSVVSILIDHFGLMGMKTHQFKAKKLIGLTIITLGIVIMTIF